MSDRWFCTLGTIAALVETTEGQSPLDEAARVFRRHRGYAVDEADIAIRPATDADIAAFERARDGADITELSTLPVPVADEQEALW